MSKIFPLRKRPLHILTSTLGKWNRRRHINCATTFQARLSFQSQKFRPLHTPTIKMSSEITHHTIQGMSKKLDIIWPS